MMSCQRRDSINPVQNARRLVWLLLSTKGLAATASPSNSNYFFFAIFNFSGRTNLIKHGRELSVSARSGFFLSSRAHPCPVRVATVGSRAHRLVLPLSESEVQTRKQRGSYLPNPTGFAASILSTTPDWGHHIRRTLTQACACPFPLK
jgi:hypothetical protein